MGSIIGGRGEQIGKQLGRQAIGFIAGVGVFDVKRVKGNCTSSSFPIAE